MAVARGAGCEKGESGQKDPNARSKGCDGTRSARTPNSLCSFYRMVP